MRERYHRQWHDPTAEKAIRLADRDRHCRQRSVSTQDIVRAIGDAYYRARIDPSGELHALFALLEPIQKGGRNNG